MKKFALLFTMIFFSSIMFGQSLKEKRIQYFVDAASKEYSLSKEQTKELLALRTVLIKDLSSILQKVKKGEVSKDDQKSLEKAPNKAFKNSFEKITGKTNAELQPFYIRMTEEIPNLK